MQKAFTVDFLPNLSGLSLTPPVLRSETGPPRGGLRQHLGVLRRSAPLPSFQDLNVFLKIADDRVREVKSQHLAT